MNRFRVLIAALALVAVLLAGLVVGFGLARLLPRGNTTRTYNTATILRQVQTLAQLVSVRYVFEKVLVGEDVKWYGQNRVILVAHGVVKAGVDLQKLEPDDVRVSGKKVSIRLPPAAILDVHLDDEKTQVVENSTGLLRLFNKDLEQDTRRLALGALRRAAHEHGILKEADLRAREQLSHLFGAFGFDQIEFSR
jgi:hypothetical protein